MGGKGRALDNIFVERLWRADKYDEVYLRDDVTPREAPGAYCLSSNEARPLQALGYRTPAETSFAPVP